TGVSETDFSGYPDCRDDFVKSLNVTLNLAMDETLVIRTPLMWLDKAEVWELGDELGKFEYVQEKTLTCYNGIPASGCGTCPSCELRARGLETYLQKKQVEQISCNKSIQHHRIHIHMSYIRIFISPLHIMSRV